MRTTGADKPALTLFSRPDCALCDELQAQLESWDAGRGLFELTVVDIETDPALSARYGLRIPLLVYGETELCAGRFRADLLESLNLPARHIR